MSVYVIVTSAELPLLELADFVGHVNEKGREQNISKAVVTCRITRA